MTEGVPFEIRRSPIQALLFAALACIACANPTAKQDTIHDIWFVGEANGIVRSRPVLVGNSVFFATADGAIVARDIATGAQTWRRAPFATRFVAGADLLTAGTAIIAVGEREVVGLDVGNGNVLWRFQ